MVNPALATMLGDDSPADLLQLDIASDIYWLSTDKTSRTIKPLSAEL